MALRTPHEQSEPDEENLRSLGRMVRAARGASSRSAASLGCGVSERWMGAVERAETRQIRAKQLIMLGSGLRVPKEELRQWLSLAGYKAQDSDVLKIEEELTLSLGTQHVESSIVPFLEKAVNRAKHQNASGILCMYYSSAPGPTTLETQIALLDAIDAGISVALIVPHPDPSESKASEWAETYPELYDGYRDIHLRVRRFASDLVHGMSGRPGSMESVSRIGVFSPIRSCCYPTQLPLYEKIRNVLFKSDSWLGGEQSLTSQDPANYLCGQYRASTLPNSQARFHEVSPHSTGFMKAAVRLNILSYGVLQYWRGEDGFDRESGVGVHHQMWHYEPPRVNQFEQLRGERRRKSRKPHNRIFGNSKWIPHP